jgi:anti-sigma factor RsiW
MNSEDQQKIQALLDGELSPAEARELSGLIQRDPAAAALLAELKNTRQTLQSAESRRSVPETREFYWSKIEREIQRQPLSSPARPASSLLSKLRLLILPAAAVTALVIVALAGHFYPAPPPVAQTKTAEADTPAIETAMASTDATTYRDAREGTTLVWFSDTTRNAPASVPKPTGPN